MGPLIELENYTSNGEGEQDQSPLNRDVLAFCKEPWVLFLEEISIDVVLWDKVLTNVIGLDHVANVN